MMDSTERPIPRDMRRLVTAALCGAALVLLSSGCATTAVNATGPKVSVEVLDALRRYETAYLLQPGDVVEVFVYRHAEFSRRSTVRPDGYISLPLLGDVRAGGLTPAELGRALTERFSERLKSPEVTVIVENPPEPMVFVVGEVGGPRPVPFRQAKTVAQAIAYAGPLAKSGDLHAVSVVRLNALGQLESHALQSEASWSQPEVIMALQGVALKPNDVVFVPESFRAQLVRLGTDINTIFSPYYQLRIIQEITR
jgi:polysaccharide biosynthesis/export protein